jgi:mitofilin
MVTLTLLGALAFSGGVWYSRINDSFHDFFTEYIPFGEQAVLYAEENEFRKRFPNVAGRVTNPPRGGDAKQVTIPAQSGASWRVADHGEPAGRQSSAVPKAKGVPAAKEAKKEDVPAVKEAAPAPKAETKEVAARTSAPEVPVAAPTKTPEPVAVVAAPVSPAPAPAKKTEKPYKAPEVNEPSSWPPAAPIDPLSVKYANDPVVQDLVHIINDIITVVNADGAAEKYGSTFDKARWELQRVGDKIQEMKEGAEKEAAQQLHARVQQLDTASADLVARVQAAMVAQETEWRREFEEEMKSVRASYDEKLHTVVERERLLNTERTNNALLEQAIELQRQFASEVKRQVEEERESRLGRLGELNKEVAELERLTTGFNDVVDTSLKTQQLHVAVEAVRASLADPAQPRPFVRELVALKETAADDAVVDAAIASIDPAAYQRGVASPAELVDRFRRVAGEVRKASLLPEDAGVASHASSWVLSKMLFKKDGLAAGDDVESILTRTQTYLEEGDLDNAAREMNGLTGWAKVLSKDWLGEVRKVLEVQQALEVCAMSPNPPSRARGDATITTC